MNSRAGLDVAFGAVSPALVQTKNPLILGQWVDGNLVLPEDYLRLSPLNPCPERLAMQ